MFKQFLFQDRHRLLGSRLYLAKTQLFRNASKEKSMAENRARGTIEEEDKKIASAW